MLRYDHGCCPRTKWDTEKEACVGMLQLILNVAIRELFVIKKYIGIYNDFAIIPITCNSKINASVIDQLLEVMFAKLEHSIFLFVCMF